MQVGQIILLLPNTMAQTGLLAGVVLQVRLYLPAAAENEVVQPLPSEGRQVLHNVLTIQHKTMKTALTTGPLACTSSEHAAYCT